MCLCFQLYTSFVQIFGIVALAFLLYLQKKQRQCNKNHSLYDPHNGSFYLLAGLFGTFLTIITSSN